MKTFLLFLCICVFCSTGTKIILPPPTSSSSATALLFIQGASLSPDQYVPILSTLQKASTSSLWIGISDFTLNMPDPLTISSMLSDLLSEMKAKGMPTPSKTFYAGHSLGGIVLASHLKDIEVDGVILLGSFLNRSVRSINPDGTSKIDFPSRTLTIGNELDGQCRISRIAEQFYHSINNIESGSSMKFPVAVVKGASHMQFASGEPPLFVKMNDLKPEISEEEAHQKITSIIAAFIDENSNTLQQTIMDTAQFLQPFIDSLILEGSYHLNSPCYDKVLVNRNVKDCSHGSPWLSYAQNVMSGFSDYNIKNVNLITDDNFHRVWEINPVHLPTCNTTCSNNSGTPCDLYCITVTELNYEISDDLDTGFYPTTAYEIKSKINSRQRILEHTNLKLDFHITDEINTCAVINKQAYEYALSNANPETVERFKKYGEPYEFGDDKGPYNAGPLWIWTYLTFDEKTSPNGDYYIEVDSPMMRTPTDYFLPMAAGFHYCKLLSPARAMEWIHLDGLKRKLGLNSN